MRFAYRHKIQLPNAADLESHSTSARVGPRVLLAFRPMNARAEQISVGMMRVLKGCSFASIWMGVSLLLFQPTCARGEEATVQGVSQYGGGSIAKQAGPGLLSPFLHLSLRIDEGYDDNSSTSGTGGRGSLFTDGKITLFYDRQEVETQVNLIAIAGGTYFDNARGATPYDVDTSLALFLSRNVTERLKLAASIFAAYRTEPDFSTNVGINNRRGNYFTTQDKFTVTYHWTSRFATVPTFAFQRIQYENSFVGMSINRSDYTFGNEFRFNLSPRTILVSEYRFEIVDYDSFTAANSTTHFALLGVDEDFSERLKFTVRGGATFRSFNSDGSRIDPHFETSLDYVPAPRSTLSWQTRYGVEEANASAASTFGPMSRTTFRTGLLLNYALSARITADISGYYHHDENEGLPSSGTAQSAFSQDAYDLSLTLRYTIKPRFAFDLGFRHSQVTRSSNQPTGQFAQPFSRNRYSAGLTLTF
jgi:hypothetical protein